MSVYTFKVDNSNPFRETIHTIRVPQIGPKQGAYVVEFQGEGVVSRALIRKGAIICLQRKTVAGVELSFYNQDGARIEELSLWRSEQKVAVKGTHIIPYGKDSQNIKIYAVWGDLADTV